MKAIAILAAACMAGCSAHSHVHYGSPAYGVSVSASGGTALAVLLGAAFFTTAYQSEREGTSMNGSVTRVIPSASATRAVPDLAPDRRVSEQDCTKPVDWSQGNIRCK